MSQREKLLAVAVASLVGLMAVYIGYTQVTGKLRQRRNVISQLQHDIDKAKSLKNKGVAASRRLEEYRRLSLPADLDEARLQYHRWLGDQVASAGLDAKSVKPAASPRRSEVYQQLTYNVQARGTIEELTKFLFAFYSADELHRIRSMMIKPMADSKSLDLGMIVDASLVPGAEKTVVGQQKSTRLDKDLDAYMDAIVNRNVFSPANRPPELSRIGSQETGRGETLSFTARADDPDEDELVFELGDDAPEAAEISESGRFSWRPTENGDYEFTVKVRDDGMPAKEDSQTVSVTVGDPKETVAERSGIDKSKFAYVCGIVESDSDRQLVLHLRTEDDTQFLKKGETVKIGPFEGVITRIGASEVEIRTEDGDLSVRVGENLADARIIEGEEL